MRATAGRKPASAASVGALASCPPPDTLLRDCLSPALGQDTRGTRGDRGERASLAGVALRRAARPGHAER